MHTTERLYYQDSHLIEFDARVVAVAPLGDGRAGVRLDRTAFYPTGGGQPSDTGLLGEAARVVECVDEEAAGVLHVVEGDAPEVGAVVRGRVDWARRLDHIQQHTGQHILSQAFVELFRAETRAFRMMEFVSEIDVALADPSDEKIERAVSRANEIIWANRALKVHHHVTPEEAARMPLRKDSAREGELRVIEIEGFDMSPCGGTHAHATGEVGVVMSPRWERAKGLARVEFVAGGRAHADYLRANRAARGAAALLGVGRDEAAAAVARLQDEHKQLSKRVRALEEVAARVEAGELLAEAAVAAASSGVGLANAVGDGGASSEVVVVVARAFEGRDAESLKRLALAVINANARGVALLGSFDGASATGGEARLVFARGVEAHGDMSALMREACATLAGRGGGRADMAQGGGHCDGVGQLARVVAEAARRVRAEEGDATS